MLQSTECSSDGSIEWDGTTDCTSDGPIEVEGSIETEGLTEGLIEIDGS